MSFLKDLLENWASLYSNHAALRTAVEFFHIAGLVIGGGSAIAADRLTLRFFRRPDRQTQRNVLRGTHRIVLAGLAAVVASGVLLFAADAEALFYSWIFWLKIGLFAALLTNGAALVHAENQVVRGDDSRWNRLAFSSTLSIVLWVATTLVGTALPNFN